MNQRRTLLALAISFTLDSTHLLAAARLDCKVNDKIAFKAELAGTGNGRSVNVTFSKKPSAAVATRIVEACMQVAVSQDPTHELLGTAWIGETQFDLAPSKEYLAYFPSEKKIRPFGFDEALKGLKRRENAPVAAQKAPVNTAQEVQWQTVLRAGAAIRAAMRNPQSLVYEGIWANGDASLMCFQYRAQNGFGGMSKENVVIQKGKASQAPAAWNKNCAGGQLESMDLALWQLNRQ